MNRRRRGAAAIAMVVMLVVVTVSVLGIVQGGSRDHDLTLRRMQTVHAFYAAEAGMNMAIRELMNNADEDGDGGVGSISDDGNDANDPALDSAQVVVTAVVTGPQTTLTSTGRSGAAVRKVEAVFQ